MCAGFVSATVHSGYVDQLPELARFHVDYDQTVPELSSHSSYVVLD